MGSPSGFLIRNWTLKLSAFGFALLLWVVVRAESPNRQEISGGAVQVMVGDSAWALVSEPIPASVTVRFGGPSRQLISMAFDRPTVVIPLEEVAQADTVVQLSTAWVQIGDRQGVVAEDIQPSSVRLTLEPVERVDSEVSGVPVLLPSALQSSTWLQVEPKTGTVVLRGARSLLEGPEALTGLALMVQIDSDEIPPAGAEGEFPLSLTGVPPLLTGGPGQGMAVVWNGGEPPR